MSDPNYRSIEEKKARLSFWRKLARGFNLVLRGVLILLLLPIPILALYKFIAPPITPLMVIRLFQGEGLKRYERPMTLISDALPLAVIAGEDNRFCSHWGVEIEDFREQIEIKLRGGRARGASTVTMQLAKNLFLWPSRSPVRKGIEIWLTPYLELILGKTRIMELYLNVVEFGPGIYGAEAAARHHFNKPAAKLTEREAALLAAVLPNPRRFSASVPSGYVLDRAATLQARMNQLGEGVLDCLDLPVRF
jgi:monofunctional biosynthetic peptidoglycan transglycosylase